MIGKAQIAERIKHPLSIKETELEDFKTLSEKHPYTSLFSILYLRGLKLYNSTLFDEALKQHSYRIADRAQLFNLLQQADFEPINSEELADAHSAETNQPGETTEPETIEEVKEPEVEIELSIEQTIEDEHTGLVESKETSEELNIEFTPSDNVEENILHHAYAQNYQLEELTPEEEETLTNRKVEKEEELPEVKYEETPQDIISHSSFVGWLHADKNFEETINLEEDKIKSIVHEFDGFDPLEQLTGEVERPKQEFFSPTKKAKESLNEETLPVSETLAKIYALQGNYTKAIEAYEQLSLKIPEKKTFFANLIQELKNKKLNN